MAVWKKVIVSGSAAHLLNVTASAVSASQYIVTPTQVLGAASLTGTIITGSFSGSFSGTVSANITSAITASVTSVTDTTLGTGPYYLTFKDATTGHPLDRIDSTGLTYNATTNVITGTASLALTSQTSSTVTTVTDNTATTYYIPFVGSSTGIASETLRVDAGISYVPSTDTLSLTGDLAVNGGDITTTSVGTATIFNTNATTLNVGGSATTLAFGANTSTASFAGSVVINGGLDVNGTITTIDTTNLLVADQYILLGSGSATNKPGGIVIQSGPTPNSGFGLIYDSTNDRWFTQDSASAATGLNAIAVTTTMAVVGAQNGPAASRPSDASGPIYGGATNGYGNMWIDSDTADRDIWIYV